MASVRFFLGARLVVSWRGGLLRTVSRFVMTSCFSASWKESRRAPDRKLNSSVLLLSTLRKLAQLLGMDARPNTRLLTPFPLLALVVPLR